MTLAYTLYIISFGTAFFASYIYVIYSMKTTNINLSTNLFVASVMNLSIYSIALFSWFLYGLRLNESPFFSGLQLAIWLYVISELSLLIVMIYKYRKEEVINRTRSTIQFIKSKSLKVYNGLKRSPKT